MKKTQFVFAIITYYLALLDINDLSLALTISISLMMISTLIEDKMLNKIAILTFSLSGFILFVFGLIGQWKYDNWDYYMEIISKF